MSTGSGSDQIQTKLRDDPPRYRSADRKQTALLAKLGKHSRTKGCLYIKRLADVDQTVLKKLIKNSAKKKK